MRIYITILFTIFLSTAEAGPWLKEKGKHYSQISFAYMKSNSLFHNNDPDPIQLHRDVSDHTLGLYSEYGISDKINLIGYLPIKFLKTHEEIFASNLFPDTLPAGNLQGVGNASIALKFKLAQKKYILSSQIRIESDGWITENNAGLRTGYDTWTIHPALLVGRGWDHTYISAEAGYRFRFNNYSDEFYGNIEAGYKYSKLWIVAVIEARQSMFNRNRNEANFLQTGMYVNDQEFFSPGLKLNYEFSDKFSLNAGLFGAFSGNYVMHFPSLNFGIALKN